MTQSLKNCCRFGIETDSWTSWCWLVYWGPWNLWRRYLHRDDGDRGISIWNLRHCAHHRDFLTVSFLGNFFCWSLSYSWGIETWTKSSCALETGISSVERRIFCLESGTSLWGIETFLAIAIFSVA